MMLQDVVNYDVAKALKLTLNTIRPFVYRPHNHYKIFIKMLLELLHIGGKRFYSQKVPKFNEEIKMNK